MKLLTEFFTIENFHFWTNLCFNFFLCFLICKLILVILYVKSEIHTQVRDYLINKFLQLIEVLFHAKYTICEFYQEN